MPGPQASGHAAFLTAKVHNIIGSTGLHFHIIQPAPGCSIYRRLQASWNTIEGNEAWSEAMTGSLIISYMALGQASFPATISTVFEIRHHLLESMTGHHASSPKGMKPGPEHLARNELLASCFGPLVIPLGELALKEGLSELM